MEWNGRIAVITGASSGIGWHTARALARKGAGVVLAARRLEKIQALAEEINKMRSGSALAFPSDVGKEEDVSRLFEETMRTFGRIDWLINNAGSGLYAAIEETTPEQMERIWRTNFMGTFYAIRNALPIMKKQRSGHILTVSSMAGIRGTPMNGAYCATKFAQAGLMDSLRRELASSNSPIHCTLILPGATKTEFIDAMENPSGQQITNKGFIQEPASVAEAIVEAIEHPTARVITQRFGRTLIVLNAASPSFTDWLVSKTIKKKF